MKELVSSGERSSKMLKDFLQDETNTDSKRFFATTVRTLMSMQMIEIEAQGGRRLPRNSSRRITNTISAFQKASDAMMKAVKYLRIPLAFSLNQSRARKNLLKKSFSHRFNSFWKEPIEERHEIGGDIRITDISRPRMKMDNEEKKLESLETSSTSTSCSCSNSWTESDYSLELKSKNITRTRLNTKIGKDVLEESDCSNESSLKVKATNIREAVLKSANEEKDLGEFDSSNEFSLESKDIDVTDESLITKNEEKNLEELRSSVTLISCNSENSWSESDSSPESPIKPLSESGYSDDEPVLGEEIEMSAIEIDGPPTLINKEESNVDEGVHGDGHGGIEVESPSPYEEKGEKEQSSPISVLDFIEEDDIYVSSSSFLHYLHKMERKKRLILEKIRRFESLAELDTTDLAEKEESVETDVGSECTGDREEMDEEDGEKTENQHVVSSKENPILLTRKTSVDKLVLVGGRPIKILSNGEASRFGLNWVTANQKEWRREEETQSCIKDMYNSCQWNGLEEEMEKVVMEIEMEVYASLMEEIVHDIISSTMEKVVMEIEMEVYASLMEEIVHDIISSTS